ncbi:MAG: DUF6997 domain-containing protein [Candidatus Rifleibacteriota bacterium]
MGVFRPIIEKMEREGLSFFPPTLYKQHQADSGIKGERRTQATLSIHSLSSLNKALKAAHLMIFRLGYPKSQRDVYFGLAKSFSPDWSDYFFLDENIFQATKTEIFKPKIAPERLLAFKIVPAATESSIVNLSIASGAMAYALGLDDLDIVIPGTCQSTFSFSFSPHSQINTIWDHQNGQVEIDGLFIGRRNGKKIIFFIESKTDNSTNLAKHKIFYPMLSSKHKIPKGMGVSGVYLRGKILLDKVILQICECEYQGDFFSPAPHLNLLSPMIDRAKSLEIEGYGKR